MNQTTRSTTRSAKAPAKTSPPPSMSTEWIPRRASARNSGRSGTRPSDGGNVSTSIPRSAKTALRSGDPTVVAISVGAGPAWERHAALNGVRSRLSRITFRGLPARVGTARTVNRGSSLSTVVMPTTIASTRLRHWCARRRAAGEVIQREAPLEVAILPSRL